MHYREIVPHPLLRHWVKCYWLLDQSGTDAPRSEPILPDGCIDLVIQLGARVYHSADRATAAYPQAFLIGPIKQGMTLYSAGEAATVGIRFYPFGLAPFLNLPISEVTAQVVDADLLFDPSLTEMLVHAAVHSPDHLIATLDHFLLGRITDDLYDHQLVRAASQLLYQPGAVELVDLTAKTGFTERTLQRKFARITGFNPKLLARILRFNRLRNDMMLDSSASLTTLAHRHLYFDQAHFIHDFRKFTDQTPLEFLASVKNGAIRFHK